MIMLKGRSEGVWPDGRVNRKRERERERERERWTDRQTEREREFGFRSRRGDSSSVTTDKENELWCCSLLPVVGDDKSSTSARKGEIPENRKQLISDPRQDTTGDGTLLDTLESICQHSWVIAILLSTRKVCITKTKQNKISPVEKLDLEDVGNRDWSSNFLPRGNRAG